MSQHFLSAEIRRLRDVRKEFAAREEYAAYVGYVLQTLKKYEVVVDAHFAQNGDQMMISFLVPKHCTECIGTTFGW